MDSIVVCNLRCFWLSSCGSGSEDLHISEANKKETIEILCGKIEVENIQGKFCAVAKMPRKHKCQAKTNVIDKRKISVSRGR